MKTSIKIYGTGEGNPIPAIGSIQNLDTVDNTHCVVLREVPMDLTDSRQAYHHRIGYRHYEVLEIPERHPSPWLAYPLKSDGLTTAQYNQACADWDAYVTAYGAMNGVTVVPRPRTPSALAGALTK